MVEHHPMLTSSEIGFLWAAFMEDAAANKLLKHFLSVLEDAEVLPILELARDSTEKHTDWISKLFIGEGIPVPEGFSDQDWSPNAPRLFSDTFAMRYIKHLATMGSGSHAMAHCLSTRADVRRFFRSNAEGSAELLDRIVDHMLVKGVYVRPPYMNYPGKVEYVEKQGFLSNMIGGSRPLLAVEICHLSKAVESNIIGATLLTGYGQVVKSRSVSVHMNRGKEIALKHVKLFQTLLLEDDLSPANTSDSVVTDSTLPTFSDKLMMFTLNSISALGIANYGAALAATMRADVVAMYMRLQAESVLYAEDGVNLMIENQWLEQPPQTTDRHALLERR
jgi:hypothetical protein